jgi:hypothetical protein
MQALDDQVAGYYDPDTRQLTVIDSDGELDTLARLILAHEVMHALQDQRWDLGALIDAAEGNSDRYAGLVGLVEGEATQLMTQWMLQHGMDDPGAFEDVPGLGGSGLDAMPPAIRRSLLYPYLDGLRLVLDRWGVEGWPGVDALWESPPTSSEQVMHPERYPDDTPVTIELPDLAARLGEGWSESFATTLGELDTGVWVADGAEWEVGFSLGGTTLPNGEAAAGWGGDRVASLEGPDGTWGLAWQTAWDTPDDAAEFATAAETTMADLPGAHAVLPDVDLAGGLPSPVLVLVASDQATLDRLTEVAGA